MELVHSACKKKINLGGSETEFYRLHVCFPQNLYVEALSPKVIVFGAFGKSSGLGEGMRVGSP